MKHGQFQPDLEFQRLAKLVDLKLTQSNYKKLSQKDIDKLQEKQFNSLRSLEDSFKNTLSTTAPHKLAATYQKFIDYIKKDVGNILVAQSYFRERKTRFTKISSCIKQDRPEDLMQYHINYNLILFIHDNWGDPLPLKAQDVYDRMIKTRQELIENNIPLAINRALLFYRKTNESHLSLLDLINICITGLVVGIDKYSEPYSKVWRSVCIGRMVGFMIKEYSETFVKLYPNDKKILYRANILKYRKKIEDIRELTAAVNASFQEDRENGIPAPKLPISENTIKSLLNSAHHVSTDSKINQEGDLSEDGVGALDRYVEQDMSNTDVYDETEKKDNMQKLSSEIKNLSIMQRKVIKLKGVTV